MRKNPSWIKSYFKHSVARWRFRLTTGSQCLWCERVTRRAPLHFLNPGQFARGICSECCAGLESETAAAPATLDHRSPLVTP